MIVAHSLLQRSVGGVGLVLRKHRHPSDGAFGLMMVIVFVEHKQTCVEHLE